MIRVRIALSVLILLGCGTSIASAQILGPGGQQAGRPAAVPTPGVQPSRAESGNAAANQSPKGRVASDLEAKAKPLDDTTTRAQRDPFWPIGYEPPPPESASTNVTREAARLPEDWDSARKNLKWGGSGVKKRKFYALFQGEGGTQVVEVGDVVSISDAIYVYKFRVNSINRYAIDVTPLAADPIMSP